MPSAFALFAHPDDIEFVAAGTMLLLKSEGWDLHYMNLSHGDMGSVEGTPESVSAQRKEEAKIACEVLGAHFHPSLSWDMQITYDVSLLRKLGAIIRDISPEILLTHATEDYMEDHMCTARLAVSAAFTKGMPLWQTAPSKPPIDQDIAVYHALPHGMRTPMGEETSPDFTIDISSVIEQKTAALACHASQKLWLDRSQGMDSYLRSMQDMSAETSQKFHPKSSFAEGWRCHHYIGFSKTKITPLQDSLKQYLYTKENNA